MREALESRACCMEGVLKCYRHETLETVIDRIAKAEVGGAWAPGFQTYFRFPTGLDSISRFFSWHVEVLPSSLHHLIFLQHFLALESPSFKNVVLVCCYGCKRLWTSTTCVSPAGSPLGAGGQPRRGERDRLSVRPAPGSGPLACRYWRSLLLIPSTFPPAPPAAPPLPTFSFKYTWSSGWPEAPPR